jgi:peptidoglycan/xylan/chitin deacetylase (PgdA/CDA1 family)
VPNLIITIDCEDPIHLARRWRTQLKWQHPLLAYAQPLERLARLLDAKAWPATLFIPTGEATGEAIAALKQRAKCGWEIASRGHTYCLAPTTRNKIIRADLASSKQWLLEHFAIQRPGYRAPDNCPTAATMRYLREIDFAYDASAIPSPWWGKLQQCWYPDSPSHIRCAALPTKIGRWQIPQPHSSRPSAIASLPTSCLRGTRLPLHASVLMHMPQPIRTWQLKQLQTRPDIVLNIPELSLADVSDAPCIRTLSQHHPTLRLPLATRITALSHSLNLLAAQRHIITAAQRIQLATQQHPLRTAA